MCPGRPSLHPLITVDCSISLLHRVLVYDYFAGDLNLPKDSQKMKAVRKTPAVSRNRENTKQREGATPETVVLSHCAVSNLWDENHLEAKCVFIYFI